MSARRSPTRTPFPSLGSAESARSGPTTGSGASARSLNPALSDRWEGLRVATGNHRLRRGAAGLLALLALAIGAADLVRPESSGTTAVVVTTGDLMPGTVVDEDDLAIIRVPADAAPDGALTAVSDAIELTVAGPVRRGEILTDTRLLTPRLTAAALGDIEDARIVPIRPADSALVELLRAGDRVDILSADDDTAQPQPIARNALVVLVPEVIDIDERPVLVALPFDAASTLAAASLTRGLTVTLH